MNRALLADDILLTEYSQEIVNILMWNPSTESYLHQFDFDSWDILDINNRVIELLQSTGFNNNVQTLRALFFTLERTAIIRLLNKSDYYGIHCGCLYGEGLEYLEYKGYDCTNLDDPEDENYILTFSVIANPEDTKIRKLKDFIEEDVVPIMKDTQYLIDIISR